VTKLFYPTVFQALVASVPLGAQPPATNLSVQKAVGAAVPSRQ
jgi:hypothetical protein